MHQTKRYVSIYELHKVKIGTIYTLWSKKSKKFFYNDFQCKSNGESCQQVVIKDVWNQQASDSNKQTNIQKTYRLDNQTKRNKQTTRQT